MQETVTIVLPTYNGENYLVEQLNSLLNQTYSPIHLIIADDCSKDHTREILKQYESDDRIEIYYQPKNQGVVKTIEFLLQKVNTPYYMLADQDDVWLPEKVEQSLKTLKQEKADLVFGDLTVVNQNLETMYPSFGDFMKLNRKIRKHIQDKNLNYLYNCVTGCTILAKKETIPLILPIPTDSKYLIHDHWIGIMVGLQGKLAYVEKPYIWYRQHGNNQVGTDKISHGFHSLDQVRELFLQVKLGVFGTYVKHNDKFPTDFQELNRKAYDYFQMLTQKKQINFSHWGIFHQLYKNETMSYYGLNFIIMNLPCLGRGLFKIRYAILKLLKKR